MAFGPEVLTEMSGWQRGFQLFVPVIPQRLDIRLKVWRLDIGAGQGRVGVRGIEGDRVGQERQHRHGHVETLQRFLRQHAANPVDWFPWGTDALERARKEAGIESEPDPVRLILPAPRSSAEQLRELIRGDARSLLLRSLLPADLPFALALDWLPVDGALAYLPPYWIEIR